MTRSWQRAGSRVARLVLGVVLVLFIGLLAGHTQDVAALSLPRWGTPGRQLPPPGARPARGLQEVAPPPAAEQFREALSTRKPRIAIETPAAGTLLPDGPWILRLRIEDWPLVDAGPLGLGPHLVVQLDDEAPRRLTNTEVTMPPLAPGSHRLTVYPAWPWGEAVKDPGAWRQIRIHRVAANPLSLPAQGSPQLLAVTPAEPAAAEPVLVDWLLIDTPLQNLRADDASWRLRISVNGDSFLVDRQTPLWLNGWRAGSNALQLELVDPRGQPLNPPFNSLVREVRLAADAVRPPWRGSQLTTSELAQLLGEAPPAPAPAPEPEVEPEQQAEPEPQPVSPPIPWEPDQAAAAPGLERPPSTVPTPSSDPPVAAAIEADTPSPAASDQAAMATAEAQEEPEAPAQPTPADAGDPRSQVLPSPDPTPTRDAAAEEIPDTLQGVESSDPEGSRSAEASGPPVRSPQLMPAGEGAAAAPVPAPARELDASGVPLGAPRNELNADATVGRSEPPGPLARLRRRLGR